MFEPLLALLPAKAWVALGLSFAAMLYAGLFLRKQGETLESYSSPHFIVPIIVGGVCWIYLLTVMVSL